MANDRKSYPNKCLIMISSVLLMMPIDTFADDSKVVVEREKLLPQETRDLIALDRPDQARAKAELKDNERAVFTPEERARLELLESIPDDDLKALESLFEPN